MRAHWCRSKIQCIISEVAAGKIQLQINQRNEDRGGTKPRKRLEPWGASNEFRSIQFKDEETQASKVLNEA